MTKLNVLVSSFNMDKLDGRAFRLQWLPYAAGCLIAFAKKDEEINETFNFLEPAFIPHPYEYYHDILMETDVLALTNYVWNQKYNDGIAKYYRSIRPDGIVVYGGASVPEDPKYAQEYAKKRPQVHLFFVGPGERNFAKFLKNITEPMDTHEGAFGNGWNNVNVNKDMYALPLDQIPDPYTEGIFDAIIDRIDDRVIGITLETTRGCPFKCAFCDWGGLSRSIVNRFNVDRVHKLIDWMYERADKIAHVDIIDANFGMVRRDLEMLEYMRQKTKETGKRLPLVVNGFVKNGSPYLKDTIMALSEFTGDVTNYVKNVALSFQTHSQRALDIVDRENIRNEKFFPLIQELHAEGLTVISEMIFGLPGETPESWLQTIDTDYELGMVQMRAYPLVLIVNTPMYTDEYRARHKIKSKRVWLPHDMFLPKDDYLADPDQTTKCDFTDEFRYEEVEVIYECESFNNFELIQILSYWWWYHVFFNMGAIRQDIARMHGQGMKVSEQILKTFELMRTGKMPVLKKIYDDYKRTVQEIYRPEPITKVQYASSVNFFQKGMRTWESKYFIENRDDIVRELSQIYGHVEGAQYWANKKAIYLDDKIHK